MYKKYELRFIAHFRSSRDKANCLNKISDLAEILTTKFSEKIDFFVQHDLYESA